MRDPTAELLKAMSSVGLHPKQIQWDGRFHRFPGIGQRGRGDNGWLKAYVDQRGAIFGDNRTKQYWKWPKDDAEWRESMKGLEPLSAAEVRAKQAEADAARAKAEEKAQKTVDALWADATDCTEHPYLIAKGIDSAPGLKVAPDKRGRPMLLIPMRNVDSKLKSIQRIWPDGRRLFIKHAPVKGLYTTIGAREFKRTGKKGALYVCEGWATGWSIHKATDGGAVVVAFSDHGLKVVGAIMRTKYPNARIVICADNDRFKSVPRDGENVNPGVHAARAAAKACDGEVAIPEFKSLEGKPTDFDDLRQREGPEAVRHRLDPKRAAEAVTEAWKPDPEPEPDPEPATKPDDDKKVVDGRLNDPRTFIAAGNAAGAEWYYDLRKDRPLRKAGDDWTEVKQRWSTDLAFQIGERVRRRDSSRHYHDIRYSDQMSRRLFVASLNRLERDPFRAWLEQIAPWDGIPALDKWLEILKPDGNLGLIRWAAANIVLLAIWRTYHPGTGCKQTVMLRGPSHGGKSRRSSNACCRHSRPNGSADRCPCSNCRILPRRSWNTARAPCWSNGRRWPASVAAATRSTWNRSRRSSALPGIPASGSLTAVTPRISPATSSSSAPPTATSRSRTIAHFSIASLRSPAPPPTSSTGVPRSNATWSGTGTAYGPRRSLATTKASPLPCPTIYGSSPRTRPRRCA